MRIIFAGAAAVLLSTAAATPAFAQFGGSPQQQVEGAPRDRAQAPDQDDEDEQAVAPDADEGGELAVRADGYDKPGADAADQGEDEAARGEVDNDVDQGDLDTDADQGDVDNDVDQGDVDTDADQGFVGNEVDRGDVDADEAGDVDEDNDQPGPGATAAAAGTWQGEDGRSYCRRSDGTTGLVVGGGAGALVGRGIDGGRHRAGGTIIGAIAGAVIGSAIERSANQQRCS